MTRRIFGALAAVLAVVAVAPVPLGGQTSSKRPDAAKVPRTPDGRPDFQGYWTNATFIPLERPAEFAGKSEMTDAEAIAYQKKRELQENSQSKEDIHYDNVLWQTESYSKGMLDRRTSLIFDPADGRMPPMTAEGKKRRDDAVAAMGRIPSGPEDRALQERCITYGSPSLVAGYQSAYEIVQSSNSVAFTMEMIHDTRVVSTDPHAHVGSPVRQWLGDSRGHWEGDTLVVDVTNFNAKGNYRGSGAGLHLTERYKRTADGLRYEMTVEDPDTWARPWTAALELQPQLSGMFEYACHEGNYAMKNMLTASRAAEAR